MSLLEINNLGIQFGGLKAVDDVNIKLEKGEIIGLIGPNGAGKTTVFNLLTKVYTPTTGSITLDNMVIDKLNTHAITQQGILRTFQNIRLFKSMTALQNIKVAYHNKMKCTSLECMLRLPRYWKEEKEADARAHDILKLFDMDDMADEKAENLPYGRQRKLEICRALAGEPKVLLLDEPAAGMNPIETQDLMKTIYKVRDKVDVSILLIEHDMKFVMGICERIYVLNYGKIIAHGSPSEIQHNPQVISAYLGSAEKENEKEE